MKAKPRVVAEVVPMRVRALKPRGHSEVRIRKRLAHRLTRLDAEQLQVVEIVVAAIARGAR